MFLVYFNSHHLLHFYSSNSIFIDVTIYQKKRIDAYANLQKTALLILEYFCFKLTRVKNLKFITSSSIALIIVNERFTLKVNEEPYIELKKISDLSSIFTLAGENYTVQKQGFFMPSIIIEHSGKPYAKLQWAASGKEAKIEFIKNHSFLRMKKHPSLQLLSFYDMKENAILQFSLEPRIKLKAILKLLENEVGEIEIMMLFVFGMVIYKKINIA